jgi:hypothetical protein
VKPVTIHTLLCTVYRQSPSREDTTRPVFRDLRDSALSARHRPGLGPASTPSAVRQGRKAGMARCSGLFRCLSPTSPRCPGMVGHSRDTSLQSLLQGSTKHRLKAPRCPGLLLPYKRAGQDPTRGDGQQAGHKLKAKRQQSKTPNIEINISSNHLCTLFSLFETWARRPLSQTCNPYASTSVQGNTKLSPLLDVGPSFCPNQDKPPCVLLTSPSRLGTRNTHSSV